MTGPSGRLQLQARCHVGALCSVARTADFSGGSGTEAAYEMPWCLSPDRALGVEWEADKQDYMPPSLPPKNHSGLFHRN